MYDVLWKACNSSRSELHLSGTTTVPTYTQLGSWGGCETGLWCKLTQARCLFLAYISHSNALCQYLLSLSCCRQLFFVLFSSLFLKPRVYKRFLFASKYYYLYYVRYTFFMFFSVVYLKQLTYYDYTIKLCLIFICMKIFNSYWCSLNIYLTLLYNKQTKCVTHWQM